MDTKKLRQKILDLAIRGKLVPQDPNDEPASVLLERIRLEKQQLIKEGKIKAPKGAKACDTSHYENVPDGWSRVKVKDVCIFNSGFAFSSESYKNSGTPLIRISNIKDGSVTLEECVFVDPVSDARFFVNKGDLLIAMSGATTGKMGIYEKEYPAMLNQRVGNVKIVSEEILLPGYRDLFFKSLEPQILKDAYGGAQPNISAKDICEYDLLLPPITEQYRIIQEANKYLHYLEVVEHNAEKLEENISWTKAHLLEMAISGKLVPQDPSDEPAIELLRRLNPSFKPCDNSHYPFDVPNSWQFVSLCEVTTFLSRGKSPKYSYERKYPVFAQKCNQWEGITLEKVQFLEPATLSKWPNEYKLQDGDVLINSTGTGTLGRTGIFYKHLLGNYPFILPDSHVTVIRGNKDLISQEYLYLVSRSAYMQKWMTDNMVGSTNQKELYPQALKGFMLALPPRAEQDRIVSFVKKIIEEIEVLSIV